MAFSVCEKTDCFHVGLYSGSNPLPYATCRYPNIIYLLMFPKKIWDFGLAYNSVTLPSLYLGQARWLLHFLNSVVKAFFFLFCSSQNERIPAEMYVWFSCKAIKLSTKTKLAFFLKIKFTATTWLLPPKGGYSPMKMSGCLLKRYQKIYFVGVAWTLFPPLRDTISVSNNRIIFSGITIFKQKFKTNVTCLIKKYNYDFSHFFSRR